MRIRRDFRFRSLGRTNLGQECPQLIGGPLDDLDFVVLVDKKYWLTIKTAL
jgi:hypothetical protein